MLINNFPVQYSQNFTIPEHVSDIEKLYETRSPLIGNPFLSTAEDTFIKQEDKSKAIAHRGYSSIAPENTIPAFIEAAKNGCKTIECDIEWTKDNIPVILHDKTINRTARRKDGSHLFWPKKCSSLNYKELLEYDFGLWFSDKYKGTKIPSLKELLKCAKEHKLSIYLELKETLNFDNKKAQTLADLIHKADLEDKITWISFNEDYLKIMRQIMPHARLGFLSKKTPTEKTINILKNLQSGENEVFLDIKVSKISPESAKLLKGAGFEFEAWTVNNKDILNDLDSLGCKAITTDRISASEARKYFN